MSTVDEILLAADDSDDDELTLGNMLLEDILNSADKEYLHPVNGSPTQNKAAGANSVVKKNNREGMENVESPRPSSSFDAGELNDILGEFDDEDVGSTLNNLISNVERPIDIESAGFSKREEMSLPTLETPGAPQFKDKTFQYRVTTQP